MSLKKALPSQKTSKIKQIYYKIVQVNAFQSLFSCPMQQYKDFVQMKHSYTSISLSSKCHLLSNQRWNIGFDKVSSYNSHQACYTAWSCRVPEWLCVEVWQGHPSGGNKDPSHRCHILHKHNHNVRVKPSPYCVKERMENLVLLYLELHYTQMYN